jgi:hypothetical protein
MSKDLLKKYQAYYSVRAEKYSRNPNYKNTFQAETQLAEAVLSCETLEEIREKMSNLNEMCGTALLKDQYLMEKEHFYQHYETIRAGEAERVLSRIDEFRSVSELMSYINEISAEERIRISLDESHSMHFFGDLDLLEEYLIHKNAIVPESYKKIIQDILEDFKHDLVENVQILEKNNHEWQQNWKLNPDICFEPRHFRLSPVRTEFLHELRSLYADIVQR